MAPRSNISIDAMMVNIPIGMLTQKTHRQPRTSTSSPPSAGPMMDPTPTTLMFRPIGLPRHLAGKAVIIMAMAMP